MENEDGLMRWQDWGNLILGVWLLLSTLIIPYPPDLGSAILSSYMSGVAIVVFSACAMYMPKLWEEGVNVLLGLWLVVSPWALNFVSNQNLSANAVLVGLAVVILALWAMVMDKEFIKWRKDHLTPH